MAAETVSIINGGDDDVEIRPISFYSLPAEIRVQVYDYFFADRTIMAMEKTRMENSKFGTAFEVIISRLRSFSVPWSEPPLLEACDLFPGLMRTSARIRNEATPQYREILESVIGDLPRRIASLERSAPRWKARYVLGEKKLWHTVAVPLRRLELRRERVDSALRSLQAAPEQSRKSGANRKR
ncbi:hypothetical protein B0A54_00948 [Friedmanniomyces endolithicus]|uniref:Uncharacterized protein n=1 Tax=Friedmanniomyces endolithicus TaxID=329885 RepID=A0A4U0VJ80_9PEZI|nr:hypothetical protein B0A54_00948 [Friedmanniomyces endolithicus]